MEALLSFLFTAGLLSGTITGKYYINELCYTTEGKEVKVCILDSYFFALDGKGSVRVPYHVWNVQKVGDWIGCNPTICLDMKGAK